MVRVSAKQQSLDGEIVDDGRPHYRQQLNKEGQILWEVGRDCDFNDVRDELAEVHRRWVEAGLSERGVDE